MWGGRQLLRFPLSKTPTTTCKEQTMRRFAVECRFVQGSTDLAQAGLANAGLVAATTLSEAPPGAC
jgi:hypothetical protein